MESKSAAQIPIVVFANLFPLGYVVATPGAVNSLAPHVIADALNRHARGDWGELDSDDWQENENALVRGGRLFSLYRDHTPTISVRFYVITEADRSATTVLLPEEY